ncbi:CpsD/CapB family tyrosine-protein kinase [uncultured Thiocystis sp.]|jgi:capsular exopolysaccharide synthesis family protein|uniref:CpsD/CapB family tyrosine-protein kinase n=1 Tax=uncultured Thiocystis sp. TaxID=1202134 RepID=UPI0025FFD86A|nr:CpsD/CapB family tyrosine-protein kinase [uncultured Thiocystis sp.]
MDRLKKALEKAREERSSLGRYSSMSQSGTFSEPNFGSINTPIEYKNIEVEVARLEAHRILLGGGIAANVEGAFKMLRTQVLKIMKANGWSTLLVTSPTPGNGKTVTAINLAITLARHAQQSVLLVDLDLRHPSIRTCFLDDPIPGISDFLLGDVPITDIIFSPNIEGLLVLPGREAFSHSSEALLLPKMQSLISDIRSRYSDGIIIIDMPPVLSVDDVVAVSQYWDAALLVIEEGRTTAEDVRRMYEMLKDKAILGTVLTKSDHGAMIYDYH